MDFQTFPPSLSFHYIAYPYFNILVCHTRNPFSLFIFLHRRLSTSLFPSPPSLSPSPSHSSLSLPLLKHPPSQHQSKPVMPLHLHVESLTCYIVSELFPGHRTCRRAPDDRCLFTTEQVHMKAIVSYIHTETFPAQPCTMQTLHTCWLHVLRLSELHQLSTILV